jgi:NADP-dependent 3-hydroxy acid dehydrogenase YdfG
MGKLSGKVALVTGASSGIGSATALALAAEGASVALVGRRFERLQALAQKISDNGGQAISLIADVADETQVQDMLSKTKAQLGRLDILVNNAGVMQLGEVDGAKTEDWRSMININLLGLMYTTHAALPIMKAQGGGHIVNISSTSGRVAMANCAVYAATKFGVVAFSEALRQEVHSNKIRVTIVEPGAVSTELGDRIQDDNAREWARTWLESNTPLESEDIAAAIVYAVTQPLRVNVNEILIRPTDQKY